MRFSVILFILVFSLNTYGQVNTFHVNSIKHPQYPEHFEQERGDYIGALDVFVFKMAQLVQLYNGVDSSQLTRIPIVLVDGKVYHVDSLAEFKHDIATIELITGDKAWLNSGNYGKVNGLINITTKSNSRKNLNLIHY